MKYTSYRASFAAGLLALASPVWASHVDLTRPLAVDANVKVINVSGDIEVRTWDREEVRLTGTLGTGLELETIESSSGVLFEVVNEDGGDDYDEASLELWVPMRASVIAEGVSADVTIAGAGGDSVVAESISGDVIVEASVTRVELSSVSGNVEFSGAATRGQFETVSGDIAAAGLDGEVSISTVSGDAELVAGLLERGRFETVSGSMQMDLSVRPGGRVTAQSMSGDVEIVVPREQQGEFTIQTFSGDIRTDFGTVARESAGPGSRVRHVEGASGAQFRIESFSGDVTVRRN